MPYLSKNDVEYITKHITPEETQYVTDIASTLYDVKKNCDNDKIVGREDDIIFLSNLFAFQAKLGILYNTTSDYDGSQYRNNICDVKYTLEDSIRMLSENIQSITGVIDKSCFTKIELPISNNILEILNELKQCVHNWYLKKENNMEYKGCISILNKLLEYIHKWIYVFRLIKPAESLLVSTDDTGMRPAYNTPCMKNQSDINVIDYEIPDYSNYYE